MKKAMKAGFLIGLGFACIETGVQMLIDSVKRTDVWDKAVEDAREAVSRSE